MHTGLLSEQALMAVGVNKESLIKLDNLVEWRRPLLDITRLLAPHRAIPSYEDLCGQDDVYLRTFIANDDV